MCGKPLHQFPLEPFFPCAGLPIFSLAFFTTDLLTVLSFTMELGPPVPDLPLWEPSAAVTPVTAVSTRVVGQVAQSVVEVSPLVFLPVPS